MRNRGKLWVLIFVALVGLIAFYNVATGPRFAAIRGIDVSRLLAAGMCFGAAIAGSIGLLLSHNRRSN